MTQELPMTAWLAELDVKSLTELLFRRRSPSAVTRATTFTVLRPSCRTPNPLTLLLPALSLPAIQLIEAHLALGASFPSPPWPGC